MNLVEFSQRIKMRRLELGLSLKDVAAASMIRRFYDIYSEGVVDCSFINDASCIIKLWIEIPLPSSKNSMIANINLRASRVVRWNENIRRLDTSPHKDELLGV